METGLQKVEENWLSPAELKSRVERIRRVHKDVMKVNTHYGKIFGAAKPSLWQPGAQLLLLTFQVNNDPEVIDLSTYDEAKYRVITKFHTQESDTFLGTGVGECSSLEDKYMWRASICDEEWESFSEDRRRIKFKKDYGKVVKIKQVRTNPADVSNTILKMANKRSITNGTCTCLGASEIFTQDAEDLPPDMLGEENHTKGNSSKPDITQDTMPVNAELVEVGIVQEVTIKKGVTDKKPWIRYGVVVNGTTYSTFDKKIADYAVASKGKDVKLDWKQDGKFKNLVSLSVLPPIEPEPKAEQPVETAKSKPLSEEEFGAVIQALALKAGLLDQKAIDKFIFNNSATGHKIDSLGEVPPELYNGFIDLFTYHSEIESNNAKI